jgi:hypothetical protein
MNDAISLFFVIPNVLIVFGKHLYGLAEYVVAPSALQQKPIRTSPDVIVSPMIRNAPLDFAIAQPATHSTVRFASFGLRLFCGFIAHSFTPLAIRNESHIPESS